ncbi:MAG: DUF1343 domain-containing protein [Chitinophagales bacterium]|nr:DUF1343 domain-containing protein [Chitinophagales bacterium]
MQNRLGKINQRFVLSGNKVALFLKIFVAVCLLLPSRPAVAQLLRTGAEQTERWLPLLQDKQVGLVVNHTSRIGNTHLLDTLCRLNLCVSRVFAPEHGFRGEEEAGAEIKDDIDVRTGVPVASLYGKNKKPQLRDLEGLDVVVFDIQDVGTRFYTYISTLYYVLEACAEMGKPVIVLDRPNPNGHLIDGPVLDMRYQSFIGIAPLPIAHGCTVGELARLFVGEYWIGDPCPEFFLRVIPCQSYTHHTPVDISIPPSPNLPNTRAVLLYPGLCLFEGTSFSMGRGTDFPFQVLGHPDNALDSFRFVPRSNKASKTPPQKGMECKGVDFRSLPLDSLRKRDKIDLALFIKTYQDFPNKPVFFLNNGFFELLTGNGQLRKQIIAGVPEDSIRMGWQADLEAFKAIRENYLLYK